ncbi:hypothetical protein NDU88_002992 [Pleurodeles waltl]|uniref:Uncharacterized protein n=1 Tax=Pleurodeles waltl TaxID=8319 RepID=A0AAV7W4X6_PLEWA|nr:hypothetical protein NDU88_002992 [Pleurodeles waltl]
MQGDHGSEAEELEAMPLCRTPKDPPLHVSAICPKKPKLLKNMPCMEARSPEADAPMRDEEMTKQKPGSR